MFVNKFQRQLSIDVSIKLNIMKAISYILLLLICIVIGYWGLSIPDSVRMTNESNEQRIHIIDEQSILVAEIPVGYRFYNLCFGDTLAIVKQKTNIDDFDLTYAGNYQMTKFTERNELDIDAENSLIFESGRLVAFRSFIKLNALDSEISSIITLNHSALNNRFIKSELIQNSETDFVFYTSLVNVI